MATVFLFGGTSFYPRAHLQDMLGTFDHTPSDDEVLALVRGIMDSDDRWDSLSTGRIDWLTAFSPGILVDGKPLQLHWALSHVNDEARMRREEYTHFWRDAEGDSHGLKRVECDALKVAPL